MLSYFFYLFFIKISLSLFFYTTLANGNFLNNKSVDFWYFLISRKATVPGRYLCCFLAGCLTGVFLAEDGGGRFPAAVWFLAVCFVLAIGEVYRGVLAGAGTREKIKQSENDYI